MLNWGLTPETGDLQAALQKEQPTPFALRGSPSPPPSPPRPSDHLPSCSDWEVRGQGPYEPPRRPF